MVADRTERKLSAILAADVVDYSRLIGVDDEGTLASFNGRDEARDWLAKFPAPSWDVAIGKIRSWQPAKDPSRMAAIYERPRLAGREEG